MRYPGPASAISAAFDSDRSDVAEREVRAAHGRVAAGPSAKSNRGCHAVGPQLPQAFQVGQLGVEVRPLGGQSAR